MWENTYSSYIVIKMTGNLELLKSGALNAGLNLAEELHAECHNQPLAQVQLVIKTEGFHKFLEGHRGTSYQDLPLNK
jgi:hypothetical protein